MIRKSLKLDKRILLGITVLVIILLTYGAFNFYLMFGPRHSHYFWTNSTSLSDEKIGDFALNQSIIAITPPPTTQNNHVNYDYYSYENGLTIATKHNDDKIIRIWHANSRNDIKTTKGIGISSSKSDVVSAYGKNYYQREEQGTNIIGYLDKTRHQTLEFWFIGSAVNSIRLDIDSME